MTLLVIRHAHAGDRSRWGADDDRRPLSPRGREQAAALAVALSAYPLTRILTSPYDRCVETVHPLAAARGLAVEHHDDLTEGTPRPTVAALVRELADTDAVLCSHGDVIGDLIGGLRASGVDLGERVDWQKASTWVLELAERRVVSGRYLPPPP